jgi:hypothetical protein
MGQFAVAMRLVALAQVRVIAGAAAALQSTIRLMHVSVRTYGLQ